MLGKLRKGDLVFTSDDEYAEGISVTEVLKLDGEVILIRGVDKNGKLQAVTPKEIKSYEYDDCMSTAMMPLEDSTEKEMNGLGITKEWEDEMDSLSESMQFLEGIKEYAKKAKELTGTTSPTGSLRYNTGKPEMSNIPPEFLLEMAKVMTMGAEKYGKNNWKLGNNMSVPYDSAMRHIFSFVNGESTDEESGHHHLAHAAINLMFMWYYEENAKDMDDREEMR